MKLFNSKSDQELIQLLKNSQQDFKFDPNEIKSRLTLSLTTSRMEPVKQKKLTFTFIRYSASVLAGIVLLLSGSFAFAANAQPGDTLFPINKFWEQAWLSLPWSASQKADLQTGIVAKRLKALQGVNAPDSQTRNKQLIIIQESDESIKNAVEAISANRQTSINQGQTDITLQLEQDLTELNNLAQKHTEEIQIIEISVKEGPEHETIQTHLKEIKKSQHKARIELHLEENDD